MGTPPDAQVPIAAPAPDPRDAVPLVGVTPRGYTDPAAMLRACSSPLRCEEIAHRQLTDPATLSRYNAIFLASSITCARAQLSSGDPLREWVKQGGVLWGADWSLALLEAMFPERVKRSEERADAQVVRAEVCDPALSECLEGSEVRLDYPLDNWFLLEATATGQRATCLRGDVVVEARRLSDQPLMVSFGVGRGAVVAGTMGLESFPAGCHKRVLSYVLRRGALSDVRSLRPAG